MLELLTGGLSDLTNWRDIIDLFDQAVVLRSVDGRVLDWNVGAEKIYGWSKSEVVGHDLHEILCSSHPLTVREVDIRLSTAGEWTGEFQRLSKSGEDRRVEVRSIVRTNPTGVSEIVEISIDLDALPREQQQAREMEHRYRNMFGGVTAALWELDFGETRRMIEATFNAGVRDFRTFIEANTDFLRASMRSTIVVDVNDKTVELYGAPSKAALIGKDISRFWPDESLSVYADSLVAAVEAQPYMLAETELRTWSGDPLHVLHSVAWPTENKGKGTVLVGAIDLSAVRAAEGERRRSDARYRTIFQSTAIAFLEVDLLRARQGRHDGPIARNVTSADRENEGSGCPLDLADAVVTDVNDASVVLFGGSARGDLLGAFDHLWAPTVQAEFSAAIAACLRSDARFETETRLTTLDGREIDVILTAVAPPDAQAETVVIGLLDVTERSAARAALDRMRTEMAHAARVATLGELAASIAHEVNQPLAAIGANSAAASRWLKRADPDLDELRDISDAIGRDAERAGGIVGRIRAMAQKRDPERLPLRIDDVVREVAVFIHHELQAGTVTLDLDLACAQTEVLADHVQVQQVLVNLAVNAVQAMRQAMTINPRLKVTTAPTSVGVEVTVSDNGPGVDAEAAELLFESFFSTKEAGLGIGLAICRSIIESHGGNIEVARSTWGGAAFRFTLTHTGLACGA
ncbi:hypothetical protein AYR46_20250 [Sphingobium yanoikuyae]|nr:hypothetical protein AYR46_20250 [Sphingobium yanoikuyae]